MSSLLLSIQKPFRLGDVIEVNGFLGVAKQVTARATTLIDYDGNHIQIPNSVVYKNTIRNLTANPNSRGKFVIGIGYDADVNQAQQIGLEVLTNIEAVLTDPEPQVLVDELGSSTLNLKVYFWINTHSYSLSKVASVAMKSIVLAFDEAGISMPDDAREVIFPQGVPLHDTLKARSDLQSKNAPKKYQTTADAKSKVSAPEKSKSVTDDLESDDADIRKQAQLSRDPEQGSNIL
jgi:small-conductance mechanosensitive channel